MKRLAVVILVVVTIFACACGCSSGAKEINGSCTTVVKACQDVAKNEQVTVTVSGTPVTGNDTKSGRFYITDSGSLSGDKVFITLKDPNDGIGIALRTTFKGKLNTSSVRQDSISLSDVEVVRG